MSRTRKDSPHVFDRTLEVVKTATGKYDIFLGGQLNRHEIDEDGLPEVLCVRFGYCQEEYASILREVSEVGRVVRHM
jgi:hypothetical protein